MSLLEINGLESGYGKISILYNINLGVEEGEIVSIMGPNGAGKTTLMKTIMGILKPKKGEIIFRNKKINGLEPYEIAKKGLSYGPQDNNVFSNLTVMENLEMSAFLLSEYNKAINDVFNIFPILRERKKQKAGTLSGGEQQMLNIGNAILTSPKLILLDEPCSGLAPKIRKDVYNKILEINKKIKIAILWVVEQNPEQVLPFVQKSYVLKSGEIIFGGKPETLLQDRKFQDLFLGA